MAKVAAVAVMEMLDKRLWDGGPGLKPLDRPIWWTSDVSALAYTDARPLMVPGIKSNDLLPIGVQLNQLGLQAAEWCAILDGGLNTWPGLDGRDRLAVLDVIAELREESTNGG